MGDRSYIYLHLYVDNMLFASRGKSEIQKLKSLVSIAFEMKGMGVANKIFGMEIKKDHAQEKLFLCHKEYIQNILNYFGMAISKPVCTPLITNIHLPELYAT